MLYTAINVYALYLSHLTVSVYCAMYYMYYVYYMYFHYITDKETA